MCQAGTKFASDQKTNCLFCAAAGQCFGLKLITVASPGKPAHVKLRCFTSNSGEDSTTSSAENSSKRISEKFTSVEFSLPFLTIGQMK